MSDNETNQDNVIAVDFGAKRTQQSEMPTFPIKLKQMVFTEMIAISMVLVRFRTDYAGLRIPEHLKKEQIVNLNFSTKFGVPDFAFDEKGVRASLSFSKEPVWCDIPWGAVVALVCNETQEVVTWPRSLVGL